MIDSFGYGNALDCQIALVEGFALVLELGEDWSFGILRMSWVFGLVFGLSGFLSHWIISSLAANQKSKKIFKNQKDDSLSLVARISRLCL